MALFATVPNFSIGLLVQNLLFSLFTGRKKHKTGCVSGLFFCYIQGVPRDEENYLKLRQQVIDDLGLYPAEAFDFVESGLTFTVNRIHGPTGTATRTNASRHVSGQQLCHGLRDYALVQWGMLARTVLGRWNITSTLDFGRIVFALVDSGLMQKQDDDSVEDFRNVFSFQSAFDNEYKIGCES